MSESERSMTTSDLAGVTPAEDEPVSRDSTDEAREAPRVDDSAEPAALVEPDDATRFEARWNELQTGFVDEPRQAVVHADALVAEVIQRLAAGFAEQRSRLEGHWDRGDEVSTEELRLALTRYRSFFQRLLSV